MLPLGDVLELSEHQVSVTGGAVADSTRAALRKDNEELLDVVETYQLLVWIGVIGRFVEQLNV